MADKENQEKVSSEKDATAPKESSETTIEDTKQELAEAYVDFLDKQKGGIAAIAGDLNPLKQDAVEYLLNDGKSKTKKGGTVFEKIIDNVEKHLEKKVNELKKGAIEKVSGGTITEYDKTSLNKMKALITQYKDDQTKLQELMTQIQEGTDPTTLEQPKPDINKTVDPTNTGTTIVGAGIVGTGAIIENYDKSKYKEPIEDSDTKITSKFGKRTDPVTGEKNKQHDGIDLSASKNTPVHSIVSGKVIESRKDTKGGRGNFISIQGDDGRVYSYFHLNKLPYFKTEEMVKAGDEIGKVGSTGKSTGPHLHITVKENNEPVDPMVALPEVFADYKMAA